MPLLGFPITSRERQQADLLNQLLSQEVETNRQRLNQPINAAADVASVIPLLQQAVRNQAAGGPLTQDQNSVNDFLSGIVSNNVANPVAQGRSLGVGLPLLSDILNRPASFGSARGAENIASTTSDTLSSPEGQGAQRKNVLSGLLNPTLNKVNIGETLANVFGDTISGLNQIPTTTITESGFPIQSVKTYPASVDFDIAGGRRGPMGTTEQESRSILSGKREGGVNNEVLELLNRLSASFNTRPSNIPQAPTPLLDTRLKGINPQQSTPFTAPTLPPSDAKGLQEALKMILDFVGEQVTPRPLENR